MRSRARSVPWGRSLVRLGLLLLLASPLLDLADHTSAQTAAVQKASEIDAVDAFSLRDDVEAGDRDRVEAWRAEEARFKRIRAHYESHFHR